MIRDYWITLYKRVITQTSDSAGGFTETTADSAFQGYVADMGGDEVLTSKQLGVNATAELYTETDLNVQDRIVDGMTEYEIVWKSTKFHTRYYLKKLK